MLQTSKREKADGIEGRVITSLKRWAQDRGFPTNITINTDFAKEKGYSLDSLEVINLSMCLEEDFDIKIPDEDIKNFIYSEQGEYGPMSNNVYSAPVRGMVDYIKRTLETK